MPTPSGQVAQRVFYPALRGLFGKWIYYCCLMPAKDVAKRLSFADEIHKSKKLSEWIQRQLKEGRAKEISEYLNREEQRFFNSLVVAIYKGDPAWHGFSNFKPLSKDIDMNEVPSEVEDSVGLLSFIGDEKMFAIDGQHRLAGMREAVKTNSSIGQDEISLLIVGHQETKLGRERTRRLFTTLNKTAKPVGKGEIIALDENDVMAIVTRHLVENEEWFSEDRVKFSQSDSLAAGAPELTTIGNLYDALTILFVAHTPGKLAKTQLRFIRPQDSELRKYVDLALRFFGGLAKYFPELRRYFESSSSAAPKVVKKQRNASGGHILFRPVGLRIFAEITATLVKAACSLDVALKLMSELPTELSEKPYLRVVWLPGGTMSLKGRVVCRRLLLYMLGYERNPKELKQRYAELLGLELAKVKLPGKLA